MVDDGPGLGRRLHYEAMRISSQHEKLNQLYADVRRELTRRARHTAYSCFERLRDALEAHFEMEDRVYFPAVHGFQPERGPLLDSLSEDHNAFRTELSNIHKLLEANELEQGERLLDRLVAALQVHEKREDELLAEITGATANPDHCSRGESPPETPDTDEDTASAPLAPIQRSPVDPK